MLLIRNRNELVKHLEQQLSATYAQARSETTESRRKLAESRADGINLALEAIKAWEDYDMLPMLENDNQS